MRSVSGLTLIEVLLVIGIIGVVAVLSTPFLAGTVSRNDLNQSTENIVSAMRKAQQYSMSRKEGDEWGVCLNSGNLRLFSQSCSSPGIYEDTVIPDSLNVTNFNEATFSFDGIPDITLSITISSDIESNTITLNAAGGIEVN